MKFSKILSLQKKLLLTFLSLWFITVLIASFAAYWFSGAAAQTSFDRVLKDDALALAAQVKWEPSGPRFAVDESTANLLIFDSLSPSKFSIVNMAGVKIAGNAELPVPVHDGGVRKGETYFFDLTDPPEHLRVVALRVNSLATKEWVWVLVGEALFKRNQLSHKLAAAIFLPEVILAIVVIPLLIFSIQFGLSPAKQISEAVAEKGIDDLSPLSLEGVPEELRVVILHINDLLRRLQNAVAHERRFVSDAAHQLRTPIAGIKLLIEDLARTHHANPTQPPDAEVLQELHAAATRAAHLVRQLLGLARADRDEVQLPQEFDIQDFISGVISQWQRPMAAAHKTFTLGAEVHKIGHVTINGSALLLEEAIGNLIDNAIQYGGNQITINANMVRNELYLFVQDDGVGVSEEDAASMLTPFWRGNHASSVGVGLGLPIAEKAVRQMGGSIEITSRPAFEGTSICIKLPVASSAASGLR